MDEKAVRDRLAEARAELAKIDDEREAWLNLVKGYEGILRLRASGPEVHLPLNGLETKPSVKERVGKAAVVTLDATIKAMSFRATMKRVLQEAHGEPLHAREILRRVRELGADTTAKDPMGITDLMGYSLAKSGEIEKVAPRTWRWVG